MSDIEYATEDLCLNLVINTPEVQGDHVKIILKWEKDPRSAVAGLAKIGASQDKILEVFAAAQALHDGDMEAFSDVEEEDDGD